jgi:hypothetical protein
MLGILSLLLPWVTIKGGEGTPDQYLIQDVFLGGQYIRPAFMVACSFFFAGLLLSLITPAAGFLELGGALGMLILYPSGYRDYPGDPSLSLGALVGFASATLVVLSLYYPLGPGYGSFRSRRYVGQANRLFTMSRLDSAAKFRINIFCLAGALLGLAAIGIPWFTHQMVSAEPYYAEYDSHNLFMVLDQSFGMEAMLASIVFICGSAAAFVTPLGGFAQAFGVFWFWQTRYAITGTLTEVGWIDKNYFDSGFYLSIIACATVVASMFVPLGIGYVLRRKTLRARLVIWGEPTAHL